MENGQSKKSGASRASLKRKRRNSHQVEKINEFVSPGVIKSIEPDSSSLETDVSIDVEGEPVQLLLSLKEVDEITSSDRSAKLLSLLTYPVSRSGFYESFRDKRPFHADKNNAISWKKGLASKKTMTKLLNEHILIYSADIDITSFESDFQMRSASKDNPSAAKPRDVWSKFDEGCSITFLQPQKHLDMLWKFLVTLENEFSSRIDCHVSLIPPKTKAFGPQLSLSDSFFIQSEGSSRFLIYEMSPNTSLVDEVHGIIESKSLSDKISLDVRLKAGDSLYIPSDWIYTHENTSEKYSTIIHLTTARGNTNADFMDFVMPQAFEAIRHKPEFRSKTSRSVFEFMGVSHSDKDDDSRREAYKTRLVRLFEALAKESVDLADAAVDQLAKRFTSERLPIPLTDEEEKRSATGAPDAVIYPYTKLRMIRPGIARAVVEDGMVVVYHCMDNSRTLFGAPLNPIEFELDDGPAIDGLLQAYPQSVCVSELYHPSEETDDKVSVAQALYKEGFLLIDDEASRPTNADDDENSDDPF